MTTLPAHSKFSASAADRWMRCPGSVPMSAGVVDTAGEAAWEGTCLHALLEHCLIHDIDAFQAPHLTVSKDGRTEVFEPNEEQIEVVQECIDYVQRLPGVAFPEMRVTYGEAIGQPEDEAFGTGDVTKLDGRTLHIIDAKFGHMYVEQDNNYQMLLYAIGVVLALEFLGDEIDTIVLHIMQPRVGGSMQQPGFELTRAELDKFAELFRQGAARVVEAEASYAPDDPAWQEKYLDYSEIACRWCKAAAGCPLLREVYNSAALMVEESTTDLGEFEITDRLSQIPAAELALMLKRLPLLDVFAKAVSALANMRMTHGERIPGYKMVKGRSGHRAWQDESKAKEWLLSLGATNAALYGEAKLKSPAQAESVVAVISGISKKAAKDMIESHIKRTPPKPAMVPDSHPGEPWTGSAELDEFDVLF